MLAALTGRQKLMLAAGAVALALIVNIAWAALGPGPDGDAAGDVERAVARAWKGSGSTVRDTDCSDGANGWICRVRLGDGRVVDCQVGEPTPQLFRDPRRTLGSGCGLRR